ncbi:S-adenosyl-L-methionine-dependent methyltransferase [Obelidium mucronatum]|nr:S-adenosyl-L-methionine-dependent methyltransferase [Obelidium mucronatum]
MSERVEFEGVPTGALLVPKREANQIVSVLRNLDWLKQGINVTAHLDYPNSHLLIHVSSSAAVSISRWLSDQTYSMDTHDFPSNDHKSLHAQLTGTDSPIIWLPNMRVKSPKSISLGGKKDNATYKNLPTTSIPLAQPINLEQKKKFRYIELFAGIGGFRVALDAIGGQSVFASEISDSARFTYVCNFGNEKLIFEDGSSAKGERVERAVLVGDITAIETLDIPDHDILTAGFPCQSFCKVGDRKALDDERGELFFEVVRVLKGKKPKAFILENVANLVTMEEGRVFRIIRTQLEDVGYKIRYEIIDASAYVPQTRKRVYIVGYLDPIHFNSFQFPHPPLEGSTSKSKTLRQILDSDPPPTALLLTNHQLKKTTKQLYV